MMNRKPMSNTVRKAIEGCGVSRYQIAKETGITESSLSRFVASGKGLSVEALDKLFAHLGLDVVPKKRKR
jgi:hypothetical protein